MTAGTAAIKREIDTLDPFVASKRLRCSMKDGLTQVYRITPGIAYPDV